MREMSGIIYFFVCYGLWLMTYDLWCYDYDCCCSIKCIHWNPRNKIGRSQVVCLALAKLVFSLIWNRVSAWVLSTHLSASVNKLKYKTDYPWSTANDNLSHAEFKWVTRANPTRKKTLSELARPILEPRLALFYSRIRYSRNFVRYFGPTFKKSISTKIDTHRFEFEVLNSFFLYKVVFAITIGTRTLYHLAGHMYLVFH